MAWRMFCLRSRMWMVLPSRPWMRPCSCASWALASRCCCWRGFLPQMRRRSARSTILCRVCIRRSSSPGYAGWTAFRRGSRWIRACTASVLPPLMLPAGCRRCSRSSRCAGSASPRILPAPMRMFWMMRAGAVGAAGCARPARGLAALSRQFGGAFCLAGGARGCGARRAGALWDVAV